MQRQSPGHAQDRPLWTKCPKTLCNSPAPPPPQPPRLPYSSEPCISHVAGAPRLQVGSPIFLPVGRAEAVVDLGIHVEVPVRVHAGHADEVPCALAHLARAQVAAGAELPRRRRVVGALVPVLRQVVDDVCRRKRFPGAQPGGLLGRPSRAPPRPPASRAPAPPSPASPAT